MNKLMVVGLLSWSVYEVRYSVTNAKMKHLIRSGLIIKDEGKVKYLPRQPLKRLLQISNKLKIEFTC